MDGRGGGGGRRETTPLLLKLGFALALSLASYFASQFRPKPRISSPKSPSGDDGSNESSSNHSAMAACGLKDELHILTSEEALAKVINGTSSSTIAKSSAFENEDEFLLPEFNKVVMSEFEGFPDKNAVKSMGEELEFEEREEMEREIAYFRDLVEALKERERNLEMQMIEYYGLKEQAASLRELENRLKVSVTDHKLLSLRIESLQADNQKLQAQVSDYPRIVSELESAREEVKHLKKKLVSDGEQAKRKLAELHQRIVEMLERERKHGENDVEVAKKLKRLKELEDEVTDLRKVNVTLAEENLKFAELLELTKIAANSDPGPDEVVNNLTEENASLKKEIEQLQTDRYADVEELVYLRWVNACLRYELRNYQAPSGKTVARDLSKCLSPESEQKAKTLILEYANSNTDSKTISLFDFDTESCSSSQTSSDDYSDASFDVSSSSKNSGSRKSKVISKLKKLVLGKKNERSKGEEMNGVRNSVDSVSSCISVEHSSGKNHLIRSSLDLPRMRQLDLEVQESIGERCRSDIGNSRGHLRMISEDCLSNMGHDLDREDDAAANEKVKLKKFANVLKDLAKSKRRLASFS